MNRRGQRTRRDTVTRTYPVYGSEISDDDESIVEIRPAKRSRHHRKHLSKVRPQERIDQPVVTGKI
jgi:hypothetical protein